MLEQKVRKVKYGNNIRYTFGMTEDSQDQMGYLLDLQKNSYKKFIEEGIGEVLKEFSPITDYSGKLVQVTQVSRAIGLSREIRSEKSSSAICDSRIVLGKDFEMPL